jgi:hypothetical protein
MRQPKTSFEFWILGRIYIWNLFYFIQKGPRDQASLLAFILSRHPAQILRPLVGSQLPPNGQKPILYELCSSEDCLSEEERLISKGT